MTQAAMQARFPAAPVSPAYSLMSHDHVKLKYLFDLIKPALVMVQDGPAFEKALKALDLDGVTVIHVARPCDGIKSIAFADLAATPVTQGRRGLDRGDHAGYGRQIAVHLGLDRHAQGRHQHASDDVRQCGDDDAGAAARSGRAAGDYLDWMPWNHTMGGNALFNPVLTEGGTLYIDDGRPMPGMIEETLRNLREVSPTYYANVPAGYAALAAAMEKDDALCRSFFKNLRPDGLWRRAAARRSL